MKVKTTYIANDGTEFEDKEECLAYETSLASECDFVQLYDNDRKLIDWNPDDYDGMWNHLYYIVIEPHREEEAEEWWANSFGAMLDVDPFGDMDNDWKAWKYHYHGDEPTVLAFDFAGNDSWIIFNEVYDEVKGIVRGLDLVDALG